MKTWAMKTWAMKTWATKAWTIGIMLVLSGCGGGLLAPPGPAPRIYVLSGPADVETAAPPAKWQLLIEMPNAMLDLNTSRIATRPEPTRIDYFANVAWADRVPAMLRELLLQSFDRSGKIPAVQSQSGGLKADFVLATNLANFEVEEGSAGAEVHIAITAKLIRGRDSTIIATQRFESTTPVSGDFGGAVQGFDTSLHALLPRIVDWTLTEGSRAP